MKGREITMAFTMVAVWLSLLMAEQKVLRMIIGALVTPNPIGTLLLMPFLLLIVGAWVVGNGQVSVRLVGWIFNRFWPTNPDSHPV